MGGGKTDVNPTIDSQDQKRKEAQGGRPYTPRQGGLSVQVLDPTSAIPPIGSWGNQYESIKSILNQI